MRRPRPVWLLGAAAAGTVFFNVLIVEHGALLWQVNLAVLLFLVFSAGLAVGAARTNRIYAKAMTDATGGLPSDITFHHDDDTHQTTALVTTVSGDIRSILMPAEITNRDEAITYVLEQLTGATVEVEHDHGDGPEPKP